MQHGYIKVAAAIPAVKVADCHFNAEQTEQQIKQANEQGAEIVVFPELGITGYTCQDLFTQQLLIEQAEQAVGSLLENTKTLDVIAVVGVPVAVDSILLNCAVVFQRGRILGIVPKTYLPNYSEFYEKRWFASTHHLNETSIHYAGQQALLTALRHRRWRKVRHRNMRRRMGTQSPWHLFGTCWCRHRLQSLGQRRAYRQARLP